MVEVNSDRQYDLRGKRVWVAGHKGMVGAALIRRLQAEDCAAILTVDRSDVDLRRQAGVEEWVDRNRPDTVFVAAATVGGIVANRDNPADFLYDNLCIASNIIHASARSRVQKLLFLGSSCIYPKFAEQPIQENSLLSGALEPTNEWYAIAKIAGLKLCQAYRIQHGRDFISAMPTNLYGPGDNYDPVTSHVVPALLRKAHDARANGADHIEIWGTGSPRREFLHVDDCADALVFLMKNYSDIEHINVGSGTDLQIDELAQMVMDVVGFTGDLKRDTTKPDGTPRKLMAADKLRALGWSPSISLRDGLASTYADWLVHGGADTRRLGYKTI